MPGLYPSQQCPAQYSSASLYREIALWRDAVNDVVAYLPAPGSSAATPELFAYHQQGLTELAALLQDYMEQQRQPYHKIIHGSAGTLNAAKAAKDSARRSAKRFADYYRKPQKYNQVDVTLDLRHLLAQLSNLLGWLNS